MYSTNQNRVRQSDRLTVATHNKILHVNQLVYRVHHHIKLMHLLFKIF